MLEDLAFCSGRWPRLAELAAQVLFEQQLEAPAVPVDPELEALLSWSEHPIRAVLTAYCHGRRPTMLTVRM